MSAKYPAQLTGPQIDTALGSLNAMHTLNGVVKNDGTGNYTALPVDATPTASSTNLVTSGGVKAALPTYTSDGNGHVVITLGGA